MEYKSNAATTRTPNEPKGSVLLAKLIELLAEQEGVDIKYELEEINYAERHQQPRH